MSLTILMDTLKSRRCVASVCFAGALVLFCLIFSILHSTPVERKPVVVKREAILANTQHGQIEGKSLRVLGKEVLTFIGVPYSQKMVKQNRFEKSVPPQPWKGVYKALYKKPACLQWKDSTFIAGFPNETKFLPDYRRVKQSEDCLYLNIYTPRDKLKNETKPVLVFIHGGLFLRGYINFPLYDGPTLSAAADVVVVFVAYRLGMLGFMATDTHFEDHPRNIGLSDQELALRWIQENIHNFNGDKERVTLMGHEAGAVSIAYHLTNEVTSLLFNRAILLNSAVMNPIYSAGSASAVYKTKQVIDKSGCGPTVEVPLEPPAIQPKNIKCLKQVKAEKLMKIQEDILARRIDLGFIPGDYSDHSDDRLDLVGRLGRLKQSGVKEIMLGTNNNEASVIFLLSQKLFPFNGQPKRFTSKELLEELMNFGPRKAKAYYPTLIQSLFRKVKSNVTTEEWAELLQEVFFTQSNRILLDAFDDANIQVYEYIFDHQVSNHPWPKWMKGTLHMTDIPFIFGRPLIKPEEYTEREVELSRSLVQNIGHFVKMGKPLSPYWTSSSSEKFYYNFSTKGEQLESMKTQRMKFDLDYVYLIARHVLRFYTD